MDELLKHFPKEVGIPYRIVCTDEKYFFKTVDMYNGNRQKIYFSVFNVGKEMISCLPFDFDSDESLKNIEKFHLYCEKHDYKHLMIFSTGGFWGYLFTEKYENLQNNKDALALAQEHVAEQCNFSIYNRTEQGIIDPKKNDLDYHIIGDVRRIARMPNTFDRNRGLFAIPIDCEDIKLGLEHIKKKAKKQNKHFNYYGNKYFDINIYDKKREYSLLQINCEKYHVDLSNVESVVKLFPDYVQRWLLIPEHATWEARFYFAVFCRDFGLSKEICDKLAHKYLNVRRKNHKETKYHHFKHVKVLDYAYSDKIIFPSMETLQKKGLI